MEQKRKVREVILHIPETDARIVIEGSDAFLWADGVCYEFGASSRILILLIENRNRQVCRADMKKTKDEDTDDKIVPNNISNIRTVLKEAGMPKTMRDQFLKTTGKKSDYRAKLNLAEEDIIYGEEYREEDLLPSSERKGWEFPTVQELAGGVNIRTEYLPHCLFQGVEYSRLESCVMEVYKKNPSAPATTSPLIISAVGGAGKTFSMLHLYGAAASFGKSAIYVHADWLEDEEQNLFHYICQRYFGISDRNQEAAAFDYLIKNLDPVLLLIDGMNEVSVSKQKHCCRSFNWMQKQYPLRIRGVFATRFPQWLKANLYQPLEAHLLPLDSKFLRDKNEELFQRLRIPLTPLILELLDQMSPSQLESIQSRYDLYRAYFDGLADRNSRTDGSGWIYEVLSCIAACSMEGQNISNRWLKEFCTGEKDYGFIHSWCAGEEYGLDEPDAMEKLKATGFLTKGFGDSYTIHQQYRDYLAVRYGLLMMAYHELSPGGFLGKIVDATRKYTLPEEDPAVINLRRHNNMDLGEFGFYAGLQWYYQHGEDPDLAPLLLQLGMQVAYLYDNVQHLTGLYDLHSRLEGLLEQYLASGVKDDVLHRSLPGYCFCLNKLVTRSHNIPQLASDEALLAFSHKLARYYKTWLGQMEASDGLQRAVALSGLGGVYLARYRIVADFASKNSCLDQAIEYHSQARDLRQEAQSPKLYLSYTTLGTDYYYKGKALYDNQPERWREAAELFQEAAGQHLLAVQQVSNPEKYVSWTRMAGCWHELLQLAPETELDVRQRCRQNLLAAVKSSVEALKEDAEVSGVIRLSGEIRTLLRDVSNFLPALKLAGEEEEPVAALCELYTQAFPARKKPVRKEDRIII